MFLLFLWPFRAVEAGGFGSVGLAGGRRDAARRIADNLCAGYQMMPWPIMALATFMKPAMLAPFM